MSELSDDQLALLKLIAAGSGDFLVGREHRNAIREAVEEIEHLRRSLLIAKETQDKPEAQMSEPEKCVWCGETERDPTWPGAFECGSGPAYGQSLDCASRQVAQLEAIIKRSGDLRACNRCDKMFARRPGDDFLCRDCAASPLCPDIDDLGIDALGGEVARLRAALSAAMQIICRPGILLQDVNKGQQHPEHGYWVRINNDWKFAGPALLDAINLLAGIEVEQED